jgi:transposase-like protein
MDPAGHRAPRERGVDVSARTVLSWTQTFGPQLALEARRHRRRFGRRWWVDEVFLFRGTEKRHQRTRAVVVAMSILATRRTKSG